MKKILVFIIAFISFKSAVSQIGLGVTTPHPNAYFQINSTNKGVLLPRMTAAQRFAIAPTASANGLLVFDTDSSAYMFWTGTAWKKMGGEDSSNWSLHGNLNTNPPASANNIAINFVTDTYFGTPDAKDVSFIAGGNELLRLNQFATGGRVGLSNRKPEYSLDIRTTEINNETQLQGMRLIAKPLFDLMSTSNIDKGLVFGYNPVNENEMAIWNHANNINGSIRFGLDVFNNSISPAFNITGVGQGINQRNPLYFLDIHSQSQFAAANSNSLNKNGIRISYPNQGSANNMERGLFMGLGIDGNYKSYIWNYADGTGGNTTSKSILFGIGGDLVNNTRPTIQMQDGILSIGHIRNTSAYPSVINIQTDFAHSVSKKGLSILDNNTANDELAYMGLDVSGNLELTKFVSGDITFNTGNQNRLIIKSDGKVGIGTATPLARLHVADSAVVFTAPVPSLSTTIPPPVTGNGTRMLWYPQKGAFRAGVINDLVFPNDATLWDRDNIGNFSAAFGQNNKAKGIGDFVAGVDNTSDGGPSALFGLGNQNIGFINFCAGEGNRLNGSYNTALGYGNYTYGKHSSAIGFNNLANDSSIAIGNGNNTAISCVNLGYYNTSEFGIYNMAMGFGNKTRGIYSVALGSQSFVNGNSAISIGNGNNVIGDNAAAIGHRLQVNGNNRLAVGSYNEPGGSVMKAFEVGIGTSLVPRNGFTVTQNGYTGINTANPTTELDVYGNTSLNGNLALNGFFRYSTFAAANNRVLVSDGVGNANWADASTVMSNYWTTNGNDIYNNNTGNIGIGNNNPAFLLDVNNRMRIRSGGDFSNTAGLWLNRTDNAALQAFVGIETDNTVGFYGSGSGWSFTMNTNTGKIKIADGTQADGRVLTSDANGIASWVPTNSNKLAVNATFPSYGVDLSSSAPVYTNLFIELPPGKWLVMGTYTLSQGGISLEAGQSVFVRTSFSSSPVLNLATSDIIGSGLISGHLSYPTPFAIMNGQNVVNNTSGGNKRYYVWASIEKTGSPDPVFFVKNLCGDFWLENNLVALPMN